MNLVYKLQKTRIIRLVKFKFNQIGKMFLGNQRVTL